MRLEKKIKFKKKSTKKLKLTCDNIWNMLPLSWAWDLQHSRQILKNNEVNSQPQKWWLMKLANKKWQSKKD